ncbi:MAG: ABC transporter permease [Cytophagales bacterium]
MFDIDKWQEIWQSLTKHKLRTILTAFGVFWGIFMLILLLGAGKGFENGVVSMFDGYSSRMIMFWANTTTMPQDGFKPGRQITFTNDDVIALARQVPGIDKINPKVSYWGDVSILYKTKTNSFRVQGISSFYLDMEAKKILEGRFLNLTDINEKKKVIVIGKRVKELLIGNDKTAIGEYIKLNGVYYKIVGVFAGLKDDWNGKEDAESIFMPYTTMQINFGMVNKINQLSITINEGYESDKIMAEIKAVLRKRHHVNPQDESAIGGWSMVKEFQRFQGLFFGIKFFIWFVGIGTIISGIVGVSNIMLIVVKERTKEIGIRKALGATSWSIISMIIQESVVLTLVSGYIGLIIGVGLIEGINYMMMHPPGGGQGGGSDFFKSPEVDFTVAISAVILLAVTGTLAGMIPAIRAAKILPIEALRDE